MPRRPCSDAYVARYLFLLAICLAAMFGVVGYCAAHPPSLY